MVAAESSDRPAGDSAAVDVASIPVGFASVAVAGVEFSASSATTLREVPAITTLQQTIENNTLRMAWSPFSHISQLPTYGRFTSDTIRARPEAEMKYRV